MSRKSTRPPSPVELLEQLAKDLRDLAGKQLAMASQAEELAKIFRGEKR